LLVLLSASTLLALSLYQREKERRTRVEQEKARQKNALVNRIEKEWQEEARACVKISAEELALMGDRPFSADGTEVPVVLGVHTPRRIPQRFLQGVAPLVNYLQTNPGPRAGPPLLWEMQVYTSFSNAINGLLQGEVDLMRPDPASYVFARQQATNLALLAQQVYGGEPELRAAIFTRADSGITRLADLRGRSFAFGDPESALGHYLPEAELVAAGLTARALGRLTNLAPAAVITAVRTGQFDAGVAELHEVSSLIAAGAPLRILHEMRSPNYPWVATRKLNPAAAAAITERLLSLADSNVLAAVHARLTGFQPTRPSDFDALERQMEKAKQFDPP
jgi:phosphonate transport system substrate-binding protein